MGLALYSGKSLYTTNYSDELKNSGLLTPPELQDLWDYNYNIGGECSRNGKGFLQGPPAVWVEQLTELTLVHGVSGYILCRVESGDIVRRFADEVVPAIRNALRTERGRQGKSAYADRGMDRLRPRQPLRNRGNP